MGVLLNSESFSEKNESEKIGNRVEVPQTQETRSQLAGLIYAEIYEYNPAGCRSEVTVTVHKVFSDNNVARDSDCHLRKCQQRLVTATDL